jgi:8-amino-7-oxononanoate synthase
VLRGQVECHIADFHAALGVPHPQLPAPIQVIIIGDETAAVAAAAQLREKHIFIPAIRYPTVARGAARLRVTLTAAHTAKDVAELLAALKILNR